VNASAFRAKAGRALRENGTCDCAEILRGSLREPPQRYADFEAGAISVVEPKRRVV